MDIEQLSDAELEMAINELKELANKVSSFWLKDIPICDENVTPEMIHNYLWRKYGRNKLGKVSHRHCAR